MKRVNLKKRSKLVAKGKQKDSSLIQTILGKIEINKRVQNFKNLGKQLQLQQWCESSACPEGGPVGP